VSTTPLYEAKSVD